MALHSGSARWIRVFSLVLGFVLLLASAAEAARRYSLTGPQRALRYQVPNGLTLPLANPPGVNPLIAQQQGSDPATLTLPAGVFNQGAAQPLTVPIMTPPQYIQFYTGVYFTSAPAAPAVFSAMFWDNNNTRATADFSWCPGPGTPVKPNCATNQAGQRDGRIVYESGDNDFGGTMIAVLGGAAATSAILTAGPPQENQHGPLALTFVAGRPYEFTVMDTGAPFVTTTGAVTNMGIITQPGNQIGTQMGPVFTNTGFPFTTGMVMISNPGNPPTTPASTFTGTGADNRTPLGAGNIQMVAGVLGNSDLNDENAQLATISVSLIPVDPVPSMGRIGLAVLGTLLIIGGVFAARRLPRASRA